VRSKGCVIEAAIVAATPPNQKGYGCFFAPGPDGDIDTGGGMVRTVLVDFEEDIGLGIVGCVECGGGFEEELRGPLLAVGSKRVSQ